ncbi:phosphatidylinositol glycan class L [Ophiocordyceps camponoti-floridani]|uniref:N-acetylglucosaminylphosphatidylinositol deacetylase n=1 Tax=Ophiocordyceps camponoti-floridani TaxID=2030778 RepID=A0A8H4Q8Z8_9HYPO|nr:phosphatidylinositol glycan class L [Ophiocordyceps camponoti-floridani]
MFFAPTLLAVTQPRCENHVRILAALLGVGCGHVDVVDDGRFPDSMTERWQVESLSKLLTSTLRCHRIDTLITFDATGISSHPNHRACHAASLRLPASDSDSDSDSEYPRDVYALETVSLLRKYMSVLDLLFLRGGTNAARLRFVSGWGGYRRARAAMVTAHVSQMVWFRHLWVLFSRYMVVNELVLV